MRISKIAAFGLLILFLIPMLNALGDNDSSKVIIVSPSGTVNEDATADIEVHVYDKAEYATPSPISASVLLADEISLTEKKTGVWGGQADAKVGTIIMADATIGTKSDSNVFIMSVRPKDVPEDVEIVLQPKEGTSFGNVGPGKKLDFSIEVWKNGQLKDDPNLEVYITGGGKAQEKLAKNKITTGKYETSFTVPQLKESTSYSIYAQIIDGTHYYWSNYQSFQVDFFQVWYHKTSISTTESTFDVYVADLGGKAVPSASLELNFSYRQTDTTGWKHETGGKATTDAKGKASYTITYSKVNRVVDIEGTVLSSGNLQHFYGDIIITTTADPNEHEPDPPIGFGLEVIYQEDEMDALKAGTTEDLKFKAYHTELLGSPKEYASKDIYYYAYTYKSVVKTGKATTNSNGSFSLSIPVPALTGVNYDFMYFAFDSETSPGWYDEDLTMLYYANTSEVDYRTNPEILKDPDVVISVDKLNVGSNTTITASWNKATNGTHGYAGWFPSAATISDLMNWGATQPEWEQWSGDSSGYMSRSGTSFTTTVAIPEFMPKGTYTVFVSIWEPYDMSEGYYTIYDYAHINYMSVEEGKGGTSTGGGGGDKGLFGLGKAGGVDLGLIMIVLILVIVVVLVAVVAISKKKKAAIAPAPQQPAQPVPGPVPYPPPEHHLHPVPHHEHLHPVPVHHEHAGHPHEHHEHLHPVPVHHEHAAAAAPPPQPAPAPQPQYAPAPAPADAPPEPAPAPELSPASEPQDKPTLNFCPVCGTKVTGTFCSECGMKFR